MTSTPSPACQALAASFPYLIPVWKEPGGGLIAAAKNARRILARTFPRTKFSVKTSRYSGGDSLRVSWVDGPTTAQVDAIVRPFQGGSFDGLRDCYDYERNAWRDTFGDAKYTFCTRTDSLHAVASALRTVRQWHSDVPETATPEDYKAGRLWAVRLAGDSDDLQTAIRRVLSSRTWELPARQREGVAA